MERGGNVALLHRRTEASDWLKVSPAVVGQILNKSGREGGRVKIACRTVSFVENRHQLYIVLNLQARETQSAQRLGSSQLIHRTAV